MAGRISQLEPCWLLFRARSLPPAKLDKLEQVSAYSVILILLGQHQAVSGAGQKFFFVDVRARHPLGLLEPASGCTQSPLRRRCPFSNLARRLFSEPQGFQAFGLSAFGFVLCFVLGHGFGAFGGSLFLFELRFRPFPLLGVVGQRSLLLSLETRSSYSSRCRCARSSEPPSRLAAVPLVQTRGGPVRTIPAPTTLSAVIQATEALAPKRSPSEDMLRGLLQTTAFYIGAIVCAAAMTLPCFGCVWQALIIRR